jgi:hypothetical protein
VKDLATRRLASGVLEPEFHHLTLKAFDQHLHAHIVSIALTCLAVHDLYG